jgi:hypothetical protein
MRIAVCVLLLILSGCQTGHRFTIKGQMQDDSSDGEMIYLVPLENSTKARMDSSIITKGTFEFEGSRETPEIYIIRAKPILRLTLQELLVVKESGKIIVKIGKNSRVSGTALNDSLQRWKEKKMMSDSLYAELREQYKLASEADQQFIKHKADSLNRENIDFNFNFVLKNQSNVVGKFVSKIMAESFSSEQKRSLNHK